MNESRVIAAAIAFAGIAIGGAVLYASQDVGRYQIMKSDTGDYRIDTVTGQVLNCRLNSQQGMIDTICVERIKAQTSIRTLPVRAQ